MSQTADSNMSDNVICRTCTGTTHDTSSSLVPIFVHKIENELIKDILINCTSIKVSEHDLLPQSICSTCLDILVTWYKFRKKCEENDLKLRNTLVTKQLKVLQTENITQEVNIEESTDSDSTKSFADNCTNNKIQQKSKLQCDLCGKTFTKKISLVYHLRVHEGQKNFSCTNCDKSFATSSQLSSHQRSHTGYRPHVCTICKKTFSKTSNLNVHLLLHENKKRFSCAVCDKKFSQKAHLNSHQNTHSGLRPFACHCGASFVTENNLKRHANIHIGVKNYLCNVCGNLFLSCNDLNRHLLTHAQKRKEYICDVCLKHFTRLSSLERHRKANHK